MINVVIKIDKDTGKELVTYRSGNDEYCDSKYTVGGVLTVSINESVFEIMVFMNLRTVSCETSKKFYVENITPLDSEHLYSENIVYLKKEIDSILMEKLENHFEVKFENIVE